MDETLDRERLDGFWGASVRAILRNQMPNGAIVASPDFAQYNFCWLRDGSFSAYALDVAGEHAAAAHYHQWVNESVQRIAGVIDRAIDRRESGEVIDPLEMPPARFTLEGSVVVDGWPNFQIDGYGTWLWSLGEHLNAHRSRVVSGELRDSVTRVARYLKTFALDSCYDVWEENGTAIHTSTLASVFGGLISAFRLTGDIDYETAAQGVRNKLRTQAVDRGYFVKSSENDDVDASTLWLVAPFKIFAPDDPFMKATVHLIEDRLDLDGGLRRYASDTYFGSGAWPVLTASLGWYYVEAGNTDEARRCLSWISDHFDGRGRLGEQFGGETRNAVRYQEWLDRWGLPAVDLTWSHAMYLILSAAIDRQETTIATRGLESGILTSESAMHEARPSNAT